VKTAQIPVPRYRTTVEAIGAKADLGSVSWCYEVLERIAQVADMRILVPPTVVRVPVLSPAEQIRSLPHDFGVSGCVIWIESGAQVHTWPEHAFAALDMFSCKEFDPWAVIECWAECTQAEQIVPYLISAQEPIKGWRL